MNNLNQLGWDARFEGALEALSLPAARPFRVVAVDRGFWRLGGDGGEARGVLAGRFRFAHPAPEEAPAVGDWVAAEPSEDGPARILAVLPRRTLIARKAAGDASQAQAIAANVETLFIAMGLDGDFNLRRLERYLALAHQSGAWPVVVLTKADLAPEKVPEARRAAERASPGAPVLAISAASGAGLDELGRYLEPGRTFALVGSSGAGKSTLLGALGGGAPRTGAVRRGDDRGRHTTTRRELFVLPAGAIGIDTPGMRELALLADAPGLQAAFVEVEALSARCRFADCRHGGEPGCAIAGALAEGTLDAGRLENWRKLEKERAHQRRQGDRRAAEEELRRWKQITMAHRRNRKDAGR